MSHHLCFKDCETSNLNLYLNTKCDDKTIYFSKYVLELFSENSRKFDLSNIPLTAVGSFFKSFFWTLFRQGCFTSSIVVKNPLEPELFYKQLCQ